jgi:F0F1-type ATP synthase delta subunit
VLLLEIRDYARWFAHESIKKRVNADHVSDAPDISPAATVLIRDMVDKKSLDQKNLDTLIETLEEYKKTAPSLTITLSAPPTGGIKNSLVAWCRENIAPNVLVTFRFNSALLGGMILHSGSRVFDWSFRRQLLAARANFPEVLRRV